MDSSLIPLRIRVTSFLIIILYLPVVLKSVDITVTDLEVQPPSLVANKLIKSNYIVIYF